MSDPEETIDRRKFLTKSAALLAGGAALARTALSYDKILGANDRISVCHIGNGSRGGELGWIVSQRAGRWRGGGAELMLNAWRQAGLAWERKLG